jgi:hypothetical protein
VRRQQRLALCARCPAEPASRQPQQPRGGLASRVDRRLQRLWEKGGKPELV